MKHSLIIFFLFTWNILNGQEIDISIIKSKVDSLIEMAHEYKFQERINELDTVITKALELLGHLKNQESKLYADCLSLKGHVLTNKRKLEEGELVLIKAHEIYKSLFGVQSQNYAESLSALGYLYLIKGKYNQAKEKLFESENIYKANSGQKEANYIQVLSNIGTTYWRLGDLEKADSFYLLVKNIYEDSGETLQKGYGKILNNLGLVCWNLGKYEQAENFYLESLDIKKKIGEGETLNSTYTLGNLALLYQNIGRYESAEKLFIQVRDEFGKHLGNEHPNYALTLVNLSLLRQDLGQYELAERNLLVAKQIYEKVYGKKHPAYTRCTMNLALLYYRMNRFEEAEKLYETTKNIQSEILGVEHRQYTLTLNNYAVLCQKRKNFAKAENILLELQEIYERTIGTENLRYALVLLNLAITNEEKREYDLSDAQYNEFLRIIEQAEGKNHEKFAYGLYNLGNFHLRLDRFEKADSLFLEAKGIFEKNFGNKHPNYAKVLRSLGKTRFKQNNFEEGMRFLLEENNINKQNLLQNIAHLSEVELHKYLSAFENRTNLFYSLNHFHSDPQLIAETYNNILFYKGFLMNNTLQIEDAITYATDSIQNLYWERKGVLRLLSQEYSKPISLRKEVEGLEEKANSLEKTIAMNVNHIQDANQLVTWQQVQSQLQENEAAIEFIHYKYSVPEAIDSVFYSVVILTKNQKAPVFLPLFMEHHLDSLIQLSKNPNDLYAFKSKKTESLYHLIWRPIEKYVEGKEKIYVSLSGLLHQLNLNAIPISEVETLANTHQLIQLNSTRQLVVPSRIRQMKKDAMLFGGITYEQELANPISDVVAVEPHDSYSSRGILTFNQTPIQLRGNDWKPLQWTEIEVQMLDLILQEQNFKTKVYNELVANEEAFKQVGQNSPSPRILHLATHGYFFPDPKSENSQQTVVGSQDDVIFKISEHPMIRSGLILAGANHAWEGNEVPEGKEDGILTAYEISQMNLSNTELVVLSACETGLGDIEGNEGVYGLQRAFKIAGAKYLIMSLWQVPDFQTQELMTTFYTEWLEGKKSIPEAFRSAQKQMKERFPEPFYWAGFVLVE